MLKLFPKTIMSDFHKKKSCKLFIATSMKRPETSRRDGRDLFRNRKKERKQTWNIKANHR